MAVDKSHIAEILEEIGQLLELKGENAFKIRAYQSGARALNGLEDDLDLLIAENRLVEVPGIGKALAEKIATLRQTGNLPFYDDLKGSLPPGLLEMLEIPGFGPKKIRKVHESLGVSTVEELKTACETGKIAELDGFGAKSQENILRGIANRLAYSQRHLWWDAQEIAQPLLEGLRMLPEVVRAEAAGSLRRARETVGDLDFIVASDKPQPIMEWFTTRSGVQEVTAKGETKSSVRFVNGLQADIRVVPPDRFVFALHHFTGSKEHNVKMRQRALSMGFSMSEWGLFDKDVEKQEGSAPWDRPLAVTGIQTEEDLFKALGLAYIPPELREGMEELEWGEEGNIPQLVEEADLRGCFHNHTNASDGTATLEQMAAAADIRGWQYLGIADHSKSSYQANGMQAEALLAQVEKIRAINASGKHKVRLFAGCEVDILKDGSLDFEAEILNQLDYVVLSVHASMSGVTEQAMTERICKAMATPLKVPKMLGHLTGRLLLRREGYAVNIGEVIRVALREGVLIELNANPWRLDMDWHYWRKAADAGMLCVINPDAHATGDLDYVKAGILTARKAGLTQAQVFNTYDLKQLPWPERKTK